MNPGNYPEELQEKCKKHNEYQPCWDCCDEHIKDEKNDSVGQ